MQTTRPINELAAVSEHLRYEILMLNGTVDALKTRSLSQLDRNAHLESFTVHARALLHFFFPRGRIDDQDVLAAHYFPEGFWDANRGSEPSELSEVRRRVGTEIVHLSYGRLSVEPEAKRWNVPAVHAAIRGLVVTFLRLVSPEALAPLYGSLLEMTAVPPVAPALATATTTSPTIVTMINSVTPEPQGRR